MPWFIGFFGLLLAPMIASALLSFVEWDGLSLSTIRWVGAENYRQLATEDPDVPIALWNTFVYSFIAVPIGSGLSVWKNAPPAEMLAVLASKDFRSSSFPSICILAGSSRLNLSNLRLPSSGIVFCRLLQ